MRMPWQSIRNFQKTMIVKNSLDFDIRNILNKITENNYIIQKNEIISILNNIVKDENYEKKLINIYNIIKENIKNNIFFSIIYSKLCKDLFEVSEFFLEKIIEDSSKLGEYLLLSNDNNNKKDYNNLCNYNKKNDEKKSILLFFVNVLKSDKNNLNILIKILDEILDKFEKNIINIEEKENNEELIELLFIIITNMDNIEDKYKNKIIELSNYKVNNYPGLSNKIIFKLMDILDKYN